jgi:hypothetical protein
MLYRSRIGRYVSFTPERDVAPFHVHGCLAARVASPITIDSCYYESSIEQAIEERELIQAYLR